MSRTATRSVAALLGTLLACLAAASARAQEAAASEARDSADGRLVVELNRAETVESGCRLAFVMQNGLADGLTGVSFVVAIFDDRGTFDREVVLRFGGIGAGRSKVQQFDLVGQRCEAISRLLIEDVLECAPAPDAAAGCQSALTTASNAPIAFGF